MKKGNLKNNCTVSISDNAFYVYTVANLSHDLSDQGAPHPKAPTALSFYTSANGEVWHEFLSFYVSDAVNTTTAV